MYTVYLDNELLYHKNMESFSIENTKLSMEVNKTGSFRFTVRKGNPRYFNIHKMKSIVKIYDGAERIFRGRVLNSMRGFYNELQVTCEGELAFLLDSKLRPYKFQGSVKDYFSYLITEHNKQVDASRQFKVGRCTVTDPNEYIVRSDSNYPDTLTTIQEKLIKILGGYIWTREESDGVYIDYLEDFESVNQQEVVFGENLLDFEETIKGKDICTAIIPLGAKLKNEDGEETDERITICDVNNGLDYVCAPDAVEKYGYIYKVIVWDDVTVPEHLFIKGMAELQNYINLVRCIELTAIDLHALNLDIHGFRIGKYTKIKSEPHALDEILLTRKMETDILDPLDGLMILGDEAFTFVDKHTDNKKVVGVITERVENVEKNYEINKEKIDEIKNGTIILSDTEPNDKSRIWCDISVSPPIFKRWNGIDEEWNIVNDANEIISEVYQNVCSTINQLADNIVLKIGEEYYLKKDVDELLYSVKSQLSLLSDQMNLKFSETVNQIQNVNGELQEQFNTIIKYFVFDINGLIIGQEDSTSKITLQLDNEKGIIFRKNGVSFASWDGTNFYTGNIVVRVNERAQFGNFAYMPRSDGSLMFLKVSDKGINLITNGDVPQTSSAYNVAMYTPNITLISGEKYKATLVLTPAVGVTRIAMYLSEGYCSNFSFAISSANKQELSCVFTAGYSEGRTPSDNQNYARIRLYRFPDDGTVTGTTTIHSLKIEKYYED